MSYILEICGERYVVERAEAGPPTEIFLALDLDAHRPSGTGDVVASVLRDAELADPAMKIEEEVNSRTTKCGFDKKFDLYAYLKKG